MDVTHINTIEYDWFFNEINIFINLISFRNLNIAHIFSSNERLKCMIASLVHAGARIDRDENHVN